LRDQLTIRGHTGAHEFWRYARDGRRLIRSVRVATVGRRFRLAHWQCPRLHDLVRCGGNSASETARALILPHHPPIMQWPYIALQGTGEQIWRSGERLMRYPAEHQRSVGAAESEGV
jgi:hypothetical protein